MWGGTPPVYPTKLRPCNQSWLWSRLQTTLAQIPRIAPKWIYTVLKIFSPFTIFEQLALGWKNKVALKFFSIFNILFTFRIFNSLPWKQSFPWNFSLYWIYFLPFMITDQLCACPEKQSCPGIFHCLECTFYSQEFWATCMRLPWKTEGALNSQYWLYIFYHSGFLSNLCVPWKTELPWYFPLYWNIFYHSGFLSNLHLPWKTELSRNVSLYGIYFLHSEFLSNLHALAMKNRVALTFFTVFEHVFFIIQDFWATSACSEKQSCPEIFRCMGYTFYIQNFWAACACPEKQTFPWLHCTEYIFFIIHEFWVTCACPEKQSCPGIFHFIEYTLYIQEFWATCACPEKQSCPDIVRCMGYTFCIQNFSATSACPEKQSCPDIFHCIKHVFFIIQEFWVTCACPEKQRVPWNFSLHGIYFLHSGVLSNLHALALKNGGCPDIFHCIEHVFFIIQNFWATSACPKKQSCPEIFRCMEYTFHIQNFWTTCVCAEKQRVPWIHYIEYIFYYSGFLSNLHLPWKTEGALKCFAVLNLFFIILEFWVTCACPENRVALEFFTVLNILFAFRIFEQLALALKTEDALKFFAVLNIFYIILEFWATCACPEKQRVPWIYCIECIFFIIQDFWANCAFPEKQRCPGIFHCTEIYFIIQDFLANCSCPENRVCPEFFQAPPPRPPASYAYVSKFVIETSVVNIVGSTPRVHDYSVWLFRSGPFRCGRFGLAVSVTGHFGRDTFVYKELMKFVDPVQVTSSHFGQTVLLLKLKLR